MIKAKPFRTIKNLALATILLSLGACSSQFSASSDSWIKRMNNRAPTKSTIYVCHAFGCKLKYAFHPTEQDIKTLASILKKGEASPEEERQAMGKAVQWFETRVGPIIGSDKDKGGLDLYSSGIPGQMDCIDEASNTNSLMLFAAMHKMLIHHQTHAPVARGFFLDGRYPHATAVVREKESGKRFAIDSWIYDNGKFPAIKPLPVWMAASPARS